MVTQTSDQVVRPLKEAKFELVHVGEQFGPIQETVTDHKVKSFAFTVDDYSGWYFEESPFGKRIGHPALLANDLLMLYLVKYDPTTIMGLHTHEEVWFHNPVFVGETVTLQARYVDKYVRRDKGYVVTEAEATGEDGRLLIRRRGTEILRVQPGSVVGRHTDEVTARRVTGEYDRGRPFAARARADLAIGTPVTPLTKHFHQDQVSIFSRIDQFFRNIHTDLESAQSAGLRTTIAQGEMSVVFLSEMLTNFFGPSWLTSGWLSTKFIHPTYVGSTVTFAAVVTGQVAEAEGVRLELECWARDDDDQMTVVGWASGLVAG
jgi:acyl dehydratase